LDSIALDAESVALTVVAFAERRSSGLIAVLRDPPPQHVGEVGVAHRLADVVVRPRVDASFAITGHGMRGHRDHGSAPGALLTLAEPSGRFVAVHAGHLVVGGVVEQGASAGPVVAGSRWRL